MKKYNLTFIVYRTKNDDKSFHENNVHSLDKIEGDKLVEILAQFQMVIYRVMKQQIDNLERHVIDDDIPF